MHIHCFTSILLHAFLWDVLCQKWRNKYAQSIIPNPHPSSLEKHHAGGFFIIDNKLQQCFQLLIINLLYVAPQISESIACLSMPQFMGTLSPHIIYYRYDDVIMSAMTSQITSLTIVYSIAYLSADQWKYQSSALLAFVRRIHRKPENSPQKGPVTR